MAGVVDSKTLKTKKIQIWGSVTRLPSLDILNQRQLISHNLSLQQLSRVVGRLLQMGEKIVPKISSARARVCVQDK